MLAPERLQSQKEVIWTDQAHARQLLNALPVLKQILVS